MTAAALLGETPDRAALAEQTEKFTKIAEDYLKRLTLTDAQREAIQINLLDAIALATVSATGETDKKKLEEMPLSIALATHNVEALGLIGSAEARRDAWLRMAGMSGDPMVRITAMTALARTGPGHPVEHLVRIYDLSGHLTDERTLDDAIEQMMYVVGIMERDSNPERFRESADLKGVRERLSNLRTLLPQAAANADADTVKKHLARANNIQRLWAFFRAPESDSVRAPAFTPDQHAAATPTPSDETKKALELLKADDTQK